MHCGITVAKPEANAMLTVLQTEHIKQDSPGALYHGKNHLTSKHAQG